MRYLFVFVFFLSGLASAADWVVIKGGVSPDQKLAVAVYPQKTENIDDANATVLLVDQVTTRKIGPLEEISSSGGTWGNTTTNVSCQWSPDSRLLIVHYRTGRLMNSFQIYRMQGRRAVPLSLPDAKKHPKGKALDDIEYGSNPGSEVKLMEDGTILKRSWGIRPKDGHWGDFAKYGLEGFETELLYHYRFDKMGALELQDITVPPL